MSNPIAPVLILETDLGNVAWVLTSQEVPDRVAAEIEAAYIFATAPDFIEIQRATILMLKADTLELSLEALRTGSRVHSVDCDCAECLWDWDADNGV